MLNCEEVTRLFSESQERELTWRERMSLRAHTMMCAGCHNFGQQVAWLRRAMRSFSAQDQDDNKPQP